MRDKGVPRREFPRVEFGNSAERAHSQIPIIGVFVEGYVSAFFICFHRLHALVAVTLTKCAVVKKIIAEPRVGHRPLRRRSFQRRVGVNGRDCRQPTAVGHADDPNATVVLRNVL